MESLDLFIKQALAFLLGALCAGVWPIFPAMFTITFMRWRQPNMIFRWWTLFLNETFPEKPVLGPDGKQRVAPNGRYMTTRSPWRKPLGGCHYCSNVWVCWALLLPTAIIAPFDFEWYWWLAYAPFAAVFSNVWLEKLLFLQPTSEPEQD